MVLLPRVVLAAATALLLTAPNGPARSLTPARAPGLSETELSEALRILGTLDPADLDSALAARDPEASEVLAMLADALCDADAEHFREAIASYLAETSRSAGRRLAGDTCRSTPPEVTLGIARRLVVDTRRYEQDGAFREALEPVLLAALDDQAPLWLRHRVLDHLDTLLDADFDWLEGIARAWGVAPRDSDERKIEADPRELVTQGIGPIRLSFYSLPSEWVAAGEAVALLRAVRARRPERSLVVASDGEVLRALREHEEEIGLVLVDAMDRGYSPWPRDPMTFLHDRTGRTVVMARPNRQRGRERDAELPRLLVQRLPEELDRELGGLRWTESPIPFHNGQILETERITWISIHALERRALDLLGIDAVPVEAFSSPEGLDTYLAAVRQAAAELEELLDRPVSFVHPLPAVGTALERERAAWLLGGGAGFDLDSLLTLLPRPGGPTVALVGSLDLGTQLVAASSEGALASFGDTYGLAAPDSLRAALADGHRGTTARALATFLDRTADHLAELGLVVERLPTLWIPRSARRDGEPVDFLVGWNNVVFEIDPVGGPRAEGFASGLTEGDRLATAAFSAAGYRLDLLPPLPRSVRANGGYRCASNHDRGPLTPPAGSRGPNPGSAGP